MNYTEYKWDKPETCAHNYIVPAIIKIIKELKLPSEAQVLDAGCGGGSLVHTIYNDFGFKNVYGFDASKSGVELAKKSFPEIVDRFFIHNAYDKNLPSNIPQKYDIIISMEVIEHLYSPVTYLRNCNLWLKDKGYLILTTPYNGYLKNLIIAILNKFDTHFNPLWEGGHIKFFSKKTISKILEETGFEIVKFDGVGRISYLWKSMIVLARKVA